MPAQKVQEALEAQGALSGLPLSPLPAGDCLPGNPPSASEMLWCVTEKASKSDLDQVAAWVREVCEA